MPENIFSFLLLSNTSFGFLYNSKVMAILSTHLGEVGGRKSISITSKPGFQTYCSCEKDRFNNELVYLTD